MVKGLPQSAGRRIMAGRPWSSVGELASRAGLGRKELRALAAAGALQGLAGHRRQAHWAAAGAERLPALNVFHSEARLPALRAPTEGQDIVADYASLGLTLGRHPLALLRGRLQKMNMLDAAALNNCSHGSRVYAAGLVTCRQRPDTASGLVFT